MNERNCNFSRRSTHKNGWVNFPVDNPDWQNTKEGGMFVKLVVCDNRKYNDKFGICCGVNVFDQVTEQLIADDRRPQPKDCDGLEQYTSEAEFVRAFEEEQRKKREWEEYHFPFINEKHPSDRSSTSRPYLASIILGSTGWSGFSYSDGVGLWHCTYSDLTSEGKDLYDSLKSLYPGCTLHLLTFLDT